MCAKVWLNDIEFEIIKRIKYGLSLEKLTDDKNQLISILHNLKNNNLINFDSINDLNDTSEVQITKKGSRLFSDKEYQPKGA